MAHRDIVDSIENALQDDATSVLAERERIKAQRLRLASQNAPSERGPARPVDRHNLFASTLPPQSSGGSGLSPTRHTSATRVSPGGESSSSTPGGVQLQSTPSGGVFGLWSSSSPSGGVSLQQTPPSGGSAHPSVGSAYSLHVPPPQSAEPALATRTRKASKGSIGSKRTSEGPDTNKRGGKRSSTGSIASMASNSPVDSRGKQAQPRTTNTSRRSVTSESSLNMSPVQLPDRNLLPKFQVGSAKPQLKLYPLSSGNVVDLEQSELSGDEQTVLKNWFALYEGKDPANFEAWYWRGMGAGQACLACKMILKGTSSWTSPDSNHACVLCLGQRRPCIRAMNVENATGSVTGRSLHVLPAEGDDPFGYYVAS